MASRKSPRLLSGRVAAALLAAAGAVLGGGHAGADPAGSTVSAADLPGLQPSAETVAGIVGNPALPTPALTVSNTAQALQSYTSTEPQCVAVVYLADKAAYQDSSYTAIDLQTLTGDSRNLTYTVTTTTATFPTAADAAAFVAQTSGDWQRCMNKQVDLSFADQPDELWRVREPTTTSNGLAVRAANVPGGLSCSHAMATKNNVVVEAALYTNGITTDQGVKIADQMVAGIPD